MTAEEIKSYLSLHGFRWSIGGVIEAVTKKGEKVVLQKYLFWPLCNNKLEGPRAEKARLFRIPLRKSVYRITACIEFFPKSCLDLRLFTLVSFHILIKTAIENHPIILKAELPRNAVCCRIKCTGCKERAICSCMQFSHTYWTVTFHLSCFTQSFLRMRILIPISLKCYKE